MIKMHFKKGISGAASLEGNLVIPGILAKARALGCSFACGNRSRRRSRACAHAAVGEPMPFAALMVVVRDWGPPQCHQ